MTCQINIPSIGSSVTVTTRYREGYYYADSEWRTMTYRGEVLPPEPWFTPTQFKLASDDPSLPFRVLDLKQVTSIDGSVVEHSVETNIRHTHIMGSKGDPYMVTVKAGAAISCTCPAFTFRKSCRHLKGITATVDSYPKSKV